MNSALRTRIIREWNQGEDSAQDIGYRFGMTRNVVLGVVHRAGCEARPRTTGRKPGTGSFRDGDAWAMHCARLAVDAKAERRRLALEADRLLDQMMGGA